MEKESMKDKMKSGFREILIDAILETAKRVLHIETDEEGKFKSFKISKKTDDGTTYELEANIRYPGEEDSDSDEKNNDKSKVKKQSTKKQKKNVKK